MTKGILVVILFLSFLSSETIAQGKDNDTTDYAKLELNVKLLQGVRWAIEEEQDNEKIEVFHSVEIVDISKVDVETMSVRIELHLRQRWDSKDLDIPKGLFKDEDPPGTFIRAPPKILDSLWSPDSFVPNARDTKIAAFTTSQAVVHIFPNKTIVYKARMYAVLGCSFTFHWYPLDKQACDLIIESYTYPSHMVSYLWETDQSPVILTNLKLLQYDMVLPLHFENGTAGRWGVGVSYAYVLLRFTFERQIAHHMIQVFTPTILVVVISWFSFWLGLDAVPGRISLLITCVLALITMQSSMKGMIPPVNYIKAMDIWMVSCVAFVFGACLEFIIVKYIHWRKQQNLKAQEERATALLKYMTDHKMAMKSNGNTGQPISSIGAFNPYLEFYQNMNYKGYMEPGMMQLESRFIKRKLAWEELQPTVIAPRGDFMYPGQQQMIPGDWPFAKKKIPIWVTIDRVSRVAFPVGFLIFNITFWPVLFLGAANQ